MSFVCRHVLCTYLTCCSVAYCRALAFFGEVLSVLSANGECKNTIFMTGLFVIVLFWPKLRAW